MKKILLAVLLAFAFAVLVINVTDSLPNYNGSHTTSLRADTTVPMPIPPRPPSPEPTSRPDDDNLSGS